MKPIAIIVDVDGTLAHMNGRSPYDPTKYHEIFMRIGGDKREDSIIKKEIYDNQIKDKYDIFFVLDDRNRVVEMWREQGLKVLQVADGDF